MTELLIANASREKFRARIKHKMNNAWSKPNFDRVINARDFNSWSYLLFDLKNAGFPIDKAIAKYKELVQEDPSLFFLK